MVKEKVASSLSLPNESIVFRWKVYLPNERFVYSLAVSIAQGLHVFSYPSK